MYGKQIPFPSTQVIKHSIDITALETFRDILNGNMRVETEPKIRL